MKILIISPSWIGDAVISHTLYRLLFIKYNSQVKIDVITPVWNRSIINRFSEVHKIFISPYTHGVLRFIKCYKLSQSLKKERYQQTIILPNSLKSALIPWLTNIPIRTGWSGEFRYGFLNDLRLLNKKLFPLMVQRYAALAYNSNMMKNCYNLPNPLPLPQLYIKKEEIKNTLHKFHLNQYKKILIGLCPGSASGNFKLWPVYHYITLAIQLIDDGYHVVFLGSLKEQFIKKVIDNSTLINFKQHYHNLIGLTSLDEAILILASCKSIVSNDSGLMHVACALKRPVVGLYGNYSNPNFTPPLFNKSKILHNNITVHRHYKYFSIRKKNLITQYYQHCLIEITPTQVLKALQTLLN